MDCRIAVQFCMLLSRHPWLFTNWQVRAKKIHPWIFFGLKNRGAILHVAKSPSMAFYELASTSKKNTFLDFLWIEESLRNSSCAKSPIHGLFTNWQVRAKNPSLDFLWIEESLRNSSCAKPPSMAFYELASKKQKSLHGSLFVGKCRLSILVM